MTRTFAPAGLVKPFFSRKILRFLSCSGGRCIVSTIHKLKIDFVSL